MLQFLLRHRSKTSAHATSTRRQRETLALAILPIVSHWQTRVQHEPALPLAIEATVTVAGVLLLLFVSSIRGRIALTTAILSIVLLTGIPSALQAGQPIAIEVLMLSLFGALSLVLAVVHPSAKLLSLSVICSGFLALFVCLASDRNDAIVIPILWLLICMWHLVANHWEHLEVRAAKNIRRSPLVRPLSVLLATALIFMATWFTFGRIETSRAKVGVMPTSGGSQWDAPNAKSGIGSGELAIAAEKNADSFGAVDSDVMLESHEASLFDMFNETAGEPIKTRQDDPAQALRGPSEQRPHSHASQTDKGGQSFTTARQAPEFSPHKQENIRNDDILQWIGPTGIRLGMERFHTFDGFEWTSVQSPIRKDLPQIKVGKDLWSIDPSRKKPVDMEDYQLGSLRVIRLNSARMATPMMTTAVNIKDVERSDFYGIHSDGSWFMPGREKIPTLSVLHFLSDSVLEDDLLDSAAFKHNSLSGQYTATSHTATSHTATSHTAGMQLAAQLADQWTSKPHLLPYEKITSIIDHLRSYAIHDPTIGSDPQDPMLAFLQKRRGGAYLFASTAATMLRSLGFEVRLATGFYVSPDRFEISASHTPIRKEDVHTWVEVQLSDGRWIEVEPTPGFMMPKYKLSWFRMAKNGLITLAPYLATTALVSIVLYWVRAIWLNWLASFIWFLTGIKGEQTQLAWTMKVLEIRALLAKAPRDSGLNQRDWLLHMTSTDPSLAISVNQYCEVAEQVFFGEKRISPCWRTAARQMLRQMDVRYFRNHGSYATSKSVFTP